MHTYTCAICGFTTNHAAELAAHFADRHGPSAGGLRPPMLRDGRLADARDPLADHLAELLRPRRDDQD